MKNKATTMMKYQHQHQPKQAPARWYRCEICFEQLFKAEYVVGQMGTEQRGAQILNKFLIVKRTNQSKMLHSHLTCHENIRQNATYCPSCYILLNVPIQTSLARTVPIKLRHFRRYKRFIKSCSKTYQVIRAKLVEPPLFE